MLTFACSALIGIVLAVTPPTGDTGASAPTSDSGAAQTGDSGASSLDSGTGTSDPVADAGADEVVYVGEPATLDGSGSYDLDGDSLSYSWGLLSKPGGSALTDADLVDATGTAVSLTPDVEGSYVLSLVVSDGLALSSDQAQVTALARDEGCGCGAASAPGSGVLILAWLAVAARRRSRSQQQARLG